ncbi:MAG: MgtC/SapB family protein [Bosea sp. (in: a-proteobacteria)]
MDENAPLSRLAVALSIGLLIGLERGWRSRAEEERQRAAGLRTFGLSGLLGGVSGLVGQQLGGVALGLVFLGYCAAFSFFNWMEARAERSVSATSAVAGMATFMLGALAVVGDLQAAIAGAVAMALLLALRQQLHRWVASLSWPEIRSVLTLLAMTFLLLPVLPNRPVDPWGVINPYVIWVLTILIAALSFSGYVAVRIFGDRLGVMMAALAGGLASSTATTVTLARLARSRSASDWLLVAGILAAGLVMLARVAVVVAALNPALLPPLLLPLLCGGVVVALGVGAAWLLSSGDSERPSLTMTNPLELAPAFRMAGLITVIALAADGLQRAFGDTGVLVTAGISGLADVDAIVISMARMAMGRLEPSVAAHAILLAVASNTLVKAGLATYAGGAWIGLRVGLVSLAAIAAGALGAQLGRL